jgi:hypothetical protein
MVTLFDPHKSPQMTLWADEINRKPGTLAAGDRHIFCKLHQLFAADAVYIPCVPPRRGNTAVGANPCRIMRNS